MSDFFFALSIDGKLYNNFQKDSAKDYDLFFCNFAAFKYKLLHLNLLIKLFSNYDIWESLYSNSMKTLVERVSTSASEIVSLRKISWVI